MSDQSDSAIKRLLEEVQGYVGQLVLWTFFGALLVSFWVIWPAVWHWESDKAVNFTLFCSEPYIGGEVCPGTERAGAERTYSLNRATNEIVSMDDRKPQFGLITLVDCQIFDENNWYCRYAAPHSGDVRMVDGLIEYALDAEARSVRQWRYRAAKIFGWLRVLFGDKTNKGNAKLPEGYEVPKGYELVSVDGDEVAIQKKGTDERFKGSLDSLKTKPK